MALESGSRLSIYEIVAPLGAGAMGEVYHARDTNLDRDVAIKVLPEDFADDADRLGRFEREAKLLAAVNHPNIAAVYAVEKERDTPFIALELVPGSTLAERIGAGPLRVPEVLHLARQLADGLEAAHEAGVVHRDLKPDNIRVTPDDTVKVLDFGLAKSVSPEGSSDSLNLTQTGVILGTPYYMSPEQVRARPVDRRADIWAFGCVLYEALTGTRAFPGETLADVASRVLEQDPDWDALPEAAPSRVRTLIEACLTKDPRNRLRDIGDARRELDAAITGKASPEVGAAPTVGVAGRRPLTVVLVIAAVAIAAAAFLVGRSGRSDEAPSDEGARRVMRFEWVIPRGVTFHWSRSFDVAPDGSAVAFLGYPPGSSVAEAYVRRVPDGRRFERLEGATEAVGMRFDKDSSALIVNCYRDSKHSLWRVPLDGRAPSEFKTNAVLKDYSTVDWAPDGNLWVVAGKSLQAIEDTSAIPLAPLRKSTSYVAFRFLPGGRHALLEGASYGGGFNHDIGLLDMKSGITSMLIKEAANARFVSGQVLYSSGGTLYRRAFDSEQATLGGGAEALLSGMRRDGSWEHGGFAVSDGARVLVTTLGGLVAADRELVFFGADGTAGKPLSTQRKNYPGGLAAGGEFVAAQVVVDGLYQVWAGRAGQYLSELIAFPDQDCGPMAFSPDAEYVYVGATTAEGGKIYRRRVDGSTQTEPLDISVEPRIPTVIGVSDNVLAYSLRVPGVFENQELRLQPLGADGMPAGAPRRVADDNNGTGSLSPDGKWLAFTRDRSGDREVYVVGVAGTSKLQRVVSSGQGELPFWSPDGASLYYVAAGWKLRRVPMDEGVPGVSEDVFSLADSGWGLGHIVAWPDGRFLLMRKGEAERRPRALHVVYNWDLKLNAEAPKGD